MDTWRYAPFLYHAEEGKLEERMTLSAIAHFSKYIRAGAVRIGHFCYTEEIEVTSFKNPDGSIVVVMLNQTQKDLPATLRIKNECVSVVKKHFRFRPESSDPLAALKGLVIKKCEGHNS